VKLHSLAYQTDLALLRLGGTQVEEHEDHLVVRSPHNPAFYWGNFLLLAQVPAPEAAQAWLDRFAAAFPAAAHVALGFDGTGGTAGDLRWFAEQGFDAEASTVMTAAVIHEPAHPNRAAQYRALDSDEDWAQSIELTIRSHEQDRDEEPAANRAFVTEKARTSRGLAEGGHGGWFGAFAGERLVAQMGLFAAGPGLARFQSVETDPEYRRQGLAGSLVHHVSQYGLHELRARTLVMVADPDYFAIDLYRAVGFTPAEAQLQVQRAPAGG
jgi:ribosomal protein S18 acetylase RimI-like enzyme